MDTNHGKRVLVVDDERSIANALRKMLEAEGYVVETAFDGHEALRVFREFRPHAIILDVMMPKENGYRVSRMIKMRSMSSDGGHVPKILLATARRLDHDPEREEMFNRFSMADAVFYKPFDFKELLARVRALTG